MHNKIHFNADHCDDYEPYLTDFPFNGSITTTQFKPDNGFSIVQGFDPWVHMFAGFLTGVGIKMRIYNERQNKLVKSKPFAF